MAWDVEFTDGFERWWSELGEAVQDAIDERLIPIADLIYDEHLEELDREERAKDDAEEK